ncbi:MAG: FMN-binding protein [Desulfobacteraceae bacterium]|nr:MAG: FMN-binding protein [Desulfobacteraceae bacterium]
MKEIFRIAAALTVSCLIAGGVMGGVFMATAKAKKRNEILAIQQTMTGLLGYSQDRPAPPNLRLHTLYRYIVADEAATRSGYLLPAAGRGAYEFWIIALDGRLVKRLPLKLAPEAAADEQERRRAIAAALGHRTSFQEADAITVAALDGKRLAYLLPGKFPGYKTAIHLMVALNPDFSVQGVEITAHEEDPGLGGEIEKAYFKNQFKDKTLDDIKALAVTRAPLPEEQRRYLESGSGVRGALPEADINRLRARYQNEEIHAISGATISSSAVASGVKRTVRNSVHRLMLLEQAARENGIPMEF